MSYLDNTVPADTDAVQLGASRIRDLKTALNSLISQVFTDAGAFLSNWVLGPMIASDPTVDANRAIGPNHIQNLAVSTRTLANGVLSADSTGRAKMANGFIEAFHLASDFALPASSVTQTMLVDGILTADAPGRAKMANGFVTAALMAAGVASKYAVGTYTGSNSASANLTTLGFIPDVVIFTPGATRHGFGITFNVEATSGVSPIHDSYTGPGTTISGGEATGVQWQTGGFVVLATNFTFNSSGNTHAYIAFKF